jgi:hypothetical protein
MKRVMIRVGLSLMVAAGWWVQRLPAQSSAAAPVPLLVYKAPSATVEVTPASAREPMLPAVRNYLVEQKEAVKGYFNKYGRCCSSDMNNPGCMGPRAELQFVFGSCRYWFGEPCLPHQKANPETGR